MLVFLVILIILFCLVAYYFGANEFVVKPLISKRKKQAASRKIKKFMTILMDIRQYYTTMSTVPSSLYVNPKEIMLVIG